MVGQSCFFSGIMGFPKGGIFADVAFSPVRGWGMCSGRWSVDGGQGERQVDFFDSTF
jgi:hypothetical protein